MRPRALAIGAALLAGLACTRAPETATKAPDKVEVIDGGSLVATNERAPDARATARPDSGAVAPPAPTAHEDPKLAWTDEAVVLGLAKDCAYLPDGAKEKDGELSCSGNLFYQSCVADPCFSDGQETCRPRCQKSCTACDTTCTTSCGACKKKCKGEASCERRCAESCGACKQACIAAKDRCATGTCGAEYVACAKRLKAQWKTNGCTKACPAYNECNHVCGDGPDAKLEACRDKCRDVLLHACPPPFTGMCMFDGVGPDESMSDAPP